MTIAETLPTTSSKSFRRMQWRMLLAAMFCYLFFYTGRQTFGFAITGMQEEFGLSKQTLGWVSTGMLWAYAIGQAINGNLGDKYGGRRMMSAGAILSCGANWVVSFASGLTSLFVPWALNGYFQALGWAPGSRLLSNWWAVSERGKVYGFYVFAAGCASILSYVTSLVVIDVLHLEWRWIFRLPVLLMLAGGICFYLIAREKPEDMGYAPVDTGVANEQDKIHESSDGQQESSRQRYLAVLKNPRVAIAAVALGFQNAARYGLSGDCRRGARLPERGPLRPDHLGTGALHRQRLEKRRLLAEPDLDHGRAAGRHGRGRTQQRLDFGQAVRLQALPGDHALHGPRCADQPVDVEPARP